MDHVSDTALEPASSSGRREPESRWAVWARLTLCAALLMVLSWVLSVAALMIVQDQLPRAPDTFFAHAWRMAIVPFVAFIPWVIWLVVLWRRRPPPGDGSRPPR